MIITIKDHEFNTNPSGMPEELLFKGTIHTGTSIVETIYGFTEEEILSLAYKLKKLNKDFNVIHLYAPKTREHIGVKFL